MAAHFGGRIASYYVLPGSPAANSQVSELGLPSGSPITTVVRGSDVLTWKDELELLPGDIVYVVTDQDHVAQLNRLFDPPRVPQRLEEHRFYGDFMLDG